MTARLSDRELNRATLARQLLLERSAMGVPEAVAHLAGLQAQTPHTWYVGLWSRLSGVRPEQVSALLESRELVRIAVMRSTIHLLTAADCLEFRPLVDVVLHRSMSGNFGKHLAGLDRAEVVEAGRAALRERPRTFSDLGRVLARRWPGRDPASLAQGVRAWDALVQVPPRGLWGRSGQAAHVPVEDWLGEPVHAAPSLPEFVRRYLAAFGPASVADVQTWSGLTRLGEVVETLRPELVSFTGEDGRELVDLPDAPRPGGDVPAPARFLYDYDNLLLSHRDRDRVVTDAYRSQRFTRENEMPRVILLDGTTAGLWTVATERGTATLTVRTFARPSTTDVEQLEAEGADLLRFVAEGASHDIRFLGPD